MLLNRKIAEFVPVVDHRNKTHMIGDAVLDFDTDPEVIPSERLYEYSGPKNLTVLRSFEAKVDTRDSTIADLSDRLPALEKLRLDNSIILSLRDIGCSFSKLTYLSLAHCGLSSLEGISTISCTIEELYLAFNSISDLSELIGMDRLRILDIGHNCMSELSNLDFLKTCPKLKRLTISENPAVIGLEGEPEKILAVLPQIVYLDGVKVGNDDWCSIAPPTEQRTRRSLESPRKKDRLIGDRIGDLRAESPSSARSNTTDAAIIIRAKWGNHDAPHLVKPVTSPRRKVGGKP
jgi:hypothetical protein